MYMYDCGSAGGGGEACSDLGKSEEEGEWCCLLEVEVEVEVEVD